MDDSTATPTRFTVVTTAQVERTYVVEASDEEQARKRMRTHISDADMLRVGLVTERPDLQVDFTPQKIKSVEPVK